jgi:hypothetical protein
MMRVAKAFGDIVVDIIMNRKRSRSSFYCEKKHHVITAVMRVL